MILLTPFCPYNIGKPISVKLISTFVIRLSLFLVGLIGCTLLFNDKSDSDINPSRLEKKSPIMGAVFNENIMLARYADSLTVVDTLLYQQVGPGVVYGHFILPNYPLHVYLLTVDLSNPYNFIETFQAEEQVGKTEAMTKAYTRLKSKDKVPIGGINGNFWIVNGQGQPKELLGVPHSGSIRNGEMITDPNKWNRGRTKDPKALLQEIGYAIIDKQKKIWIDDMAFDGSVITAKKETYPISAVNRMRNADELVLYNHYMGTLPSRTDDEGTEIILKPISGSQLTINRMVSCEIIKIFKNKGANPISANEILLSGTGKAKVFLDNLKLGEVIKVNMGVHVLSDEKRPQITQMITGNALVMKNGVLTIRNMNEDYNSRPYPRTGIGMSKDGKKLFLVVMDRTKGSVGATTATMSNFLKLSGAWSVTSMDGGGSAQLMLAGKIMNNPSDGKERPVANGWFIFHRAPTDTQVKSIAFAEYKLASADSLRILGYNKYGVLINEDLKGFTLKTKPAYWKRNKQGQLSFQKPILIVRYKGATIQKEINSPSP